MADEVQLPACVAHLRLSLRGLPATVKKRQLKAFSDVGAKQEAISEEILEKIRPTNAFSSLPPCLCGRNLVEVKIAEVLASALLCFEFDRETRGIYEYTLAQGNADDRAAKILEGFHPRLAEYLKEEALLFAPKPEAKAECTNRTTRLEQDAKVLDHLVADLAAVLWHATRASQEQILRDVLPPILSAFKAAYSETVPRRGLGHPAKRLKRYVAYLKKADSMPLPKRHYPPAAIRTEPLLLNRSITLFATDGRFPLELFLHHKPRRRKSPRTGTNATL